MKKCIFLLSLCLLVMTTTGTFAQAVKTQEVKIKTYFDCPTAKAHIEKELLKMPGVTSVVADIQTKIVSVTFDQNKMSKERLNSVIERSGYRTELSKEGTIIKPACDGKKETHCEKKSEEK